MSKRRIGLLTTVAGILASISGCVQHAVTRHQGQNEYNPRIINFWAKRLIIHSTINGKLRQWWMGSGDKLIADGKITSHHRIKTADDIELDVWVINGKSTPDQPRPNKLPTDKGTVLLLHGLLDSKARFFTTARELSNRGYNCVLLDHRAHGRSGGRYITFGAKEKFDAKHVMDTLLASGLVREPFYVFGQSMGAATAILYSDIDPRCKATMAVAPYKDIRSVASRFVPLMSERKYDAVLARAAEIACFDPAETNTMSIIKNLTQPLLIVHGRLDNIVPYSHGKALYDAAECPKEFIEFMPYGHVSLLFGRNEWFAVRADELFTRAAKTQQTAQTPITQQ